MTVQRKWAECCILVMSGHGKDADLLLAGLNGCISPLTAITLGCQRNVRNVRNFIGETNK